MDDRDRRRVITPPRGVRAQSARPVAESWDEDSTPVESTAIDKLAWRAKRQSEHLKALDIKVEALGAHVGDLREATGSIGGKLDVLVDVVREEREERKQSHLMKLTAFSAEVEVEKTDKISRINDRAKERELRRQLITKAVAWLGPPLAALAALLASRC